MIDDLGEKAALLQVNMELITLITNTTNDIKKLCYKLVPNFVMNDENLNYSLRIKNFDNLDNIKNKIADSFMLFSDTFFEDSKPSVILESEQQYIRKIYYLMYKKDLKNGTLITFEKEKLVIFNNDILIKELFNFLNLVLSELNALKNLQNIELEKCKTSIILKKRKKELFFLEEIFNDLLDINNSLKEVIIFDSIKTKYKKIKNKILILIKNTSLKENQTIIKAYLSLIEEHLNSDSVHIGSLFYIHELFSQEKDNILFEISVYEKKLQSLVQYRDKFKMNSTTKYILKDNVQRLQDSTNEANKVFIMARDPRTAIKHSEIGKDLQLYFAKTSDDELNFEKTEEIKPQNTTEILTPDKNEANHWFKYGGDAPKVIVSEKTEPSKNEPSSIADLKTTSFGTSIKKLLSDNGLDMNMIKDLYKKD